MRSGDEEQLELLFGSVPNTLSELIPPRAFMPQGRMPFYRGGLLGHRVRACWHWLAGEEWVLDEFRGKGKIYEATASRMFHVPQETIVKGHPNYEVPAEGGSKRR